MSVTACRSSDNPAVDFAGDLAHPDFARDMTRIDMDGGDFGDGSQPDLNGSDLSMPDMYAPPFAPPVTYPTGAGPVAVETADVNVDGKPDLVTIAYVLDGGGNVMSASLDVLLGVGDGTFGAKTSLPLTFAPNSLALGDVNGDGRPDALLTGFDTNIYVSLNTTVGFAAPVTTTVDAGVAIPVARLGDIDGDGKLDVVAADFGDGTTNGFLRILLGNGDGTFPSAKQSSRTVSTSADMNALRLPYNLRIGQLDGDAAGKLDIAVLNLNSGGNQGSFTVFQNTSTSGNVVVTLATELSTGQSPTDILIAPISGAHAAIAVANRMDDNAQVFLSNTTTAGALGYGAGTVYTAFANMGSSANPSSIAYADFDKDGIDDLAILGATGGGYLTIAYGGANGAFNVASMTRGGEEVVSIGNNPVGMATGLFDANASVDVAAVQAVAADVAILLNKR